MPYIFALQMQAVTVMSLYVLPHHSGSALPSQASPFPANPSPFLRGNLAFVSHSACPAGAVLLHPVSTHLMEMMMVCAFTTVHHAVTSRCF